MTSYADYLCGYMGIAYLALAIALFAFFAIVTWCVRQREKAE